ncbi:MAG: hypothetical protein GWP06_10440 [Actinobacteria bacterium]|nr:hypothetical protein [Actinomycetota bacterium]
MINVLGISAFYHDSAACLVRDGDIIAAAQEERFTRKKHDAGFPQNAIEYCLREGGILAENIDYLTFYDKPWLKFERILETYLAYAPSGLPSFIRSMPLWIKEKLWIGDLLEKKTGYKGQIYYPEHHQSHAASAFFPSPFERAAILTIDGVGEWATASWGVGHANKIKIHSELRFPHSLGLLYSAFTYYTGFKVNSGEYKVMGLAPYGQPQYAQLILDELMDLREDGSFRLNMKYFNYCQGLTMTSKAFNKLFGGPPRKPESKLTQKDMDLARSVQDVTEEVMLRMAKHVKHKTGEKNLCLAGGVALNCVANGKILRENIFDNIWIQPAAGDAGGALGAALFVWHQVLDNDRTVAQNAGDSMRGSYLGPRYGNKDIESWLQDEQIPYRKLNNDELAQHVAQYIEEEKVIGWFSGRMEFGPRALGSRSIIGDARSEKMQSVMNLKIKYRESFRPFAPACLAEDVAKYFNIDIASPYMLLVAPVKNSRRKKLTLEQEAFFGIDKLNVPRSDIPAVTHVDFSARVQTVDGIENEGFYRLLREFKKRTGYGIVINTSFNVRGEPIVESPQDAYKCFMRTEMDVLVLENCVLLKEEQKPLNDDENWRDIYQAD